MLEKKYKDTWEVRERLEIDYQEYLNSEHWKVLKNKLSKRESFKHCKVCLSSSNIELHHRTYKRLGNGDERDVIPVCRDCHQKIHDEAKYTGVSVRIATKKVIYEYRHLRGVITKKL